MEQRTYPNRRQFLWQGSSVIVLGTAIGLAGCTGSGSDNQPGTGDGSDSDDDTENEDTGSDDGAGNEQGTGEEWIFPEDPLQSIRDAGSFTRTQQVQSSVDGLLEESSFLMDIDEKRSMTTGEFVHEDERWIMETIKFEQWTYSRITIDGAVDFEVLDFGSGFEPDTEVELRLFVDTYQDTADELTLEGEETFDGVPVQRYTHSTENIDLGDDDPVQLELFEQTIHLDENGIVRKSFTRFEWVDEDNHSQWSETEMELTEIGTTTVEDPDWLEEAIAATAS